MVFPASEKISLSIIGQNAMQVAMQVTTQVETLLRVFIGEHTRQDLQDRLKLANRENFRKNYLQPALDDQLIELTIPEKPNSSKQKYRLTAKGYSLREKLTTKTSHWHE